MSPERLGCSISGRINILNKTGGAFGYLPKMCTIDIVYQWLGHKSTKTTTIGIISLKRRPDTEMHDEKILIVPGTLVRVKSEIHPCWTDR